MFTKLAAKQYSFVKIRFNLSEHLSAKRHSCQFNANIGFIFECTFSFKFKIMPFYGPPFIYMVIPLNMILSWMPGNSLETDKSNIFDFLAKCNAI